MYVVSACELPVGSRLWQADASCWVLTVVCRATFMLRPSLAVLAPSQEAVAEEDDHWDGDPARSLRVASDLVPFKQRADVTLVGRAFAPRHEVTRSLTVRLIVGDVDKSIEVFADRYFDQEGAIHEGPRFSTMPLLYERAAGGPGTFNPVGVRGAADTYGRAPLPNLQPPGTHVTSPHDHVEPVGFGPIAASWPARMEKKGRGGAPPAEGPFPDDLDLGYFNHAPRDQQAAMLRDNERIVLEHLHPDHPRLVTSLPGVRPRAVVHRAGGKQEVALACDTLWIDTDRSICTLTWRGQVPLASRDEEGQVRFSVEASDEHTSENVTDTLVPGRASSKAQAPVLPFVASQRGAGAPAAPEARGGLPFAAPSSPPPPLKPVVPPAFGPRPPSVPAPAPAAAPPVWTPPPPPLIPQQAPALSARPLSSAPRPAAPSSPWGVPDAGAPAMTVGQMASAAEAAAAPPLPSPQPAAAERAADPPPADARPAAAKVEGRRAVQLVWFDAEILPRTRKSPRFSPLLAALEDRALDPDLDDPTLASDHVTMENRRDAFEVIARGEALDEPKLNEAIDRALREDGKFVPPVVLVAGEVRMLFDELSALKAALSIATPFSAADEALKGAIADAREFLRQMDHQCPAGVIEGFTTRVHEAFKKARRATAPTYLEDQTDRALLERRAFQTRDVFGSPHVRAQITLANASRPTPLYLPDHVGRKLPLFSRFAARILVEACLQEDQFEAHPIALRGFALARVQPMPSSVPAAPAKAAPKG